MAQVSPLKKFMKALLIFLGIGFVGLFLLLAAFLFGPSIKNRFEQIPFDSAQWKENLKGREPIKQKMVSSLLKTQSLTGKSKAEIDSLLGRPEPTSYFSGYDYVYWLGPEKGPFGIDSEWLCIKFENERVVKADLKTD